MEHAASRGHRCARTCAFARTCKPWKAGFARTRASSGATWARFATVSTPRGTAGRERRRIALSGASRLCISAPGRRVAGEQRLHRIDRARGAGHDGPDLLADGHLDPEAAREPHHAGARLHAFDDLTDLGGGFGR